MSFDVLVIGGSAAGLSCALVLGSAYKKDYAKNKRIGLIAHQKTAHLQNAVLNNVLGLAPNTTGISILKQGQEQLKTLYPHVIQIEHEKVTKLTETANKFLVTTNKNEYYSKLVVVAVGYTNLIAIKGLEHFVEPHPRAASEKQRIWLKNKDHKVSEGLYVAGTLAGWRSQFAIASGSGAHVATDILSLWNNHAHTHVHDKLS